ncbi:MAG: Proteasome-activating nucleotidase 1 [Methanomethylovorans sp. PtaU1.Bin093]|jgi:proteasome regulatory subunit|uniref:proteasome-activating nucleotidase n=1 Tax=Methanomethylovorans sp. PtaU1.Bin093 TaxID=1811679 RepID=UPI0009CBEAD6|nr:proteasome-activating nucleotidase [Methanomethylovorans sp. PtaU1.Bin093]OPY20059.1 MAG: Proteasome-activating nucleotidase 1 [Methanomethylovorans sp. PtaU1.Bin093]
MTNTSADTPVDTGSSRSKGRTEFENLNKEDVRSLLNEIELLKVNNENMRAKLLEASMMNNSYIEEISKLKKQVEHLTTPPLFIASVMEIEDNMVLIRQHGNNQEVMTKIPPALYGKLEPGMRVSVNGAFSIISIIRKGTDIRAQVMELINSPGIDYDMIGGLDEVIKEVIESVELPLTEPELFSKIGIEPPNGVLLYGAPGTGKTLIAKAVASSAKATFIRMSGSDLVQKFIGEGARLVKDVFQLARDKSPSILFIDEIDAVGGMRTHDGTTGSAEVNRTMLQLLAEMDGFDATKNVKVIAATNRIDLLDPALLRPGRFDRVIEIPLPDMEARVEILNIHTRKMKLANDIDFDKLAKITAGLSGADLQVITKEAGMFVLRRRGEQVTMKDMMDAYEKVVSEEETATPQGMFA